MSTVSSTVKPSQKQRMSRWQATMAMAEAEVAARKRERGTSMSSISPPHGMTMNNIVGVGVPLQLAVMNSYLIGVPKTSTTTTTTTISEKCSSSSDSVSSTVTTEQDELEGVERLDDPGGDQAEENEKDGEIEQFVLDRTSPTTGHDQPDQVDGEQEEVNELHQEVGQVSLDATTRLTDQDDPAEITTDETAPTEEREDKVEHGVIRDDEEEVGEEIDEEDITQVTQDVQGNMVLTMAKPGNSEDDGDRDASSAGSSTSASVDRAELRSSKLDLHSPTNTHTSLQDVTHSATVDDDDEEISEQQQQHDLEDEYSRFVHGFLSGKLHPPEEEIVLYQVDEKRNTNKSKKKKSTKSSWLSPLPFSSTPIPTPESNERTLYMKTKTTDEETRKKKKKKKKKEQEKTNDLPDVPADLQNSKEEDTVKKKTSGKKKTKKSPRKKKKDEIELLSPESDGIMDATEPAKIGSSSTEPTSSMVDSIHSSDASFYDDSNTKDNDGNAVSHDGGDDDRNDNNKKNNIRDDLSHPQVLPLRRYHSLPIRQHSSRRQSLDIETIHEVADEIDSSPVKGTKQSISLSTLTQHKSRQARPPQPRLTMDELRASLHMAAKEAADVGNHTKLHEQVVEAIAPDDSSEFSDDGDWDGFGNGSDDFDDLDDEINEFCIQVDVSNGTTKASETPESNSLTSKGVSEGDHLKSPVRQSTHHSRMQQKKDADEWKLKHGLAVENDLSRSNHYRVINEAAALGNMKRLKAICTETKQEINVEHPMNEDVGDDDNNGEKKIPIFLKRRRKLLMKASDRMDKYLEDAKMEKKKTMYSPEHIIERLQEYQEISERFADGDYGFLPTTEPPSFKAPKVWVGRNRIRSTVVQDAAKAAEKRNHRLDCSFQLHVRKKCHCKYCKSPSPFQTVAYQELRQEQRHMKKSKAPKSSKRPDDLKASTIHTFGSINGRTGRSDTDSPYSRTLLRSSSLNANQEMMNTIREMRSPVWASPDLKKTVKVEKCEVSNIPVWAEVTGKRDDNLPEWASEDLRLMIASESTNAFQKEEEASGEDDDHDGQDSDDKGNGSDTPHIVDLVGVTQVSTKKQQEATNRSRKSMKSQRRAEQWRNTSKGKGYHDKRASVKAPTGAVVAQGIEAD